MFAAPGAGLPYYATPAPFLPPPPRRRRYGLVFGILALVLIVCAGLVTAGVVYARHVGNDVASTGHAGGPASVAPSVAASQPSDPTTLNATLALQSTALIAGNEAGWMAGVDPTAAKAVAEYQRIFHNMRAMKAASWTQMSAGGDSPRDGLQPYVIDISYCLIQAPCSPMKVTLDVTAKLQNGHTLLESLSVPTLNQETSQPLPWLVANLSAAVGPRVVVAGSSAEQGRLASALRGAEQAAAAADKFAHWGKPDVYVVYLADAAEAKLWFGSVDHPDQYLGTTEPVSDTDTESVLYMPNAATDAGPGGLTQTTQWLLGNAALQYGAGGTGNNSLQAGLADYISFYGHSNWVGGTVSGARTYVHSGKWNKNVFLTSELESTTDSIRWGAEGIGFLTIRHLISRFGLAKTLDFWGAVERDDDLPADASPTVFGLPWTSVNADCVNYVEHSVYDPRCPAGIRGLAYGERPDPAGHHPAGHHPAETWPDTVRTRRPIPGRTPVPRRRHGRPRPDPRPRGRATRTR